MAKSLPNLKELNVEVNLWPVVKESRQSIAIMRCKVCDRLRWTPPRLEGILRDAGIWIMVEEVQVRTHSANKIWGPPYSAPWHCLYETEDGCKCVAGLGEKIKKMMGSKTKSCS